MPRYLSIFKSIERDAGPTEQEMAEMGQLIGDAMQEGWLLSTEGCLPTKLGVRVRRDGDTVTVKDGPFSEAKEVVGGFAIIKADSKEQAVALTKRFLAVAGDGECEVRLLYEAPAV